jgi:replicative DNA helicase
MLHSVDIERAVIGCLLTYGDKAVQAVQDEGLTVDHFWLPKHRALARACYDLTAQGLPCDDLTVERKTEMDRGTIDLCFVYSRPSSLREHARAIVEDHMWRQRRVMLEQLEECVKTRNEAGWDRILKGDRPALRVVKEDKAA